MHNTRGNYIWLVFLTSIVTFMVTSCETSTPTSTLIPTRAVMPIIRTAVPSPTASTPYIHYTPSKASNVHLIFDYPRSWDMRKAYYPEMTVISLLEPRFRTLPTRTSDDFHPIPNDYGSISIWVTSVKANQNLDALLASFIQGHSDINWIKPLDDYVIKLQGYNARVLEYQVNFGELYTSAMFVRHTAFIVEDQLYEIDFEIAEKDHGGKFEKEYEYFFNSLKIVP